ncbi:hypothetical protein [Undibacterium sp. TS12]|uniref:hypothetical protein n=1 Tax=Undibacterium sp. TS12 TaxID=2908202 RepID=UPI001F4CA104|nr:hypothetical protein [Undibacterium sp. TS12]MCH8622453.1 hypothetical protein [Undibacterium sp. TS12]
MRLMTNEELMAVAGGESNSDPVTGVGAIQFDASATREAGQNSWGESTSGGATFYAIALASAASDAAAYNRCMAENSKPTTSNQVASGITATGAGLAALPFGGPVAAGVVITAVYNGMNIASVQSNQAGCDSTDFRP